MNDLNFTNTAIAAGFTVRNDASGKFEYFIERSMSSAGKSIVFREGLWMVFNHRNDITNAYERLHDAIEAEKP